MTEPSDVVTSDGDDAALVASLEDGAVVLSARQRLDELTLNVLSAPGLAVAEVAQLSAFLAGPWLSAVTAHRRLAQGGAGS